MQLPPPPALTGRAQGGLDVAVCVQAPAVASSPPQALPIQSESDVSPPAGGDAVPLSPPSGLYPRRIRPVLGAALVACLAVPTLAVCAVIATLHVALYRRASDVFFRQQRAGRWGVPFTMVKFRTMWPDTAGKPRATRLGAALRRSKLDELPQLWNVVRGEMSLIGPRPEMLELEAWAEIHVPGFGERLCIRPGITGLAQVVQDSTPAEVDLYREKLRLNRAYVERMSLRNDFWILVRTAARPLRPRRAGPRGGQLDPRAAGLKAG